MKEFDLVYFLSRFYGINNSNLNRKKLSHEDVEILFPNVRTCPLRDVSKSDVYNGNLLMVYDKKDIIRYYYNPHMNIENNYEFNDEEIKNNNVNLDNLDNLSKNELLSYRRKVKIYGLRMLYIILTKKIREKKKLEPKMYREEKEKLKIKESYYD